MTSQEAVVLALAKADGCNIDPPPPLYYTRLAKAAIQALIDARQSEYDAAYAATGESEEGCSTHVMSWLKDILTPQEAI